MHKVISRWPLGQFKSSHVGIDVPLPNVPLSKTTGHATSTSQNYRLENKLLHELGEEMDIIISNTVQSKTSPFIKFIWEEQDQLAFATSTVWKFTTVYHLHEYKTGTEFFIPPGCHRLPYKN